MEDKRDDTTSSRSAVVSIERSRRNQGRRLLPLQQASQPPSTGVGINLGSLPAATVMDVDTQTPAAGRNAQQKPNRGARSGSPTSGSTGSAPSFRRITAAFAESRSQSPRATIAAGVKIQSLLSSVPRSITGYTASPPMGPGPSAGLSRSPSRCGEVGAGPSRVVGTRAPAGPSVGSHRPGFRKLRLGIETEFYLAAYNSALVKSNGEAFASGLAADFNTCVGPEHPRMYKFLRRPEDLDDYTQWSMVYDGSIWTQKSPCKPRLPRLSLEAIADPKFSGGLEMRSPIFEVFPNSQWRAHVKEAWTYLKRSYQVTADKNCSTHIHISLVPNYSLAELKQIASCVVYFEPAFEALVPEHRRGNQFARSNWLNSPCLARQGRSRLQSIIEIESAADEVEVFALVQGYETSCFSWNFWSFFTFKGTIEFRQPPASLTLAETLGWAELAFSFIQSSVQYGSSKYYFPADIGGLRNFLALAYELGVNEPHWLQSIWGDKPGDVAVAPKPVPPNEHEKLTKDTKAQMRELLQVRQFA